MKKNKIKLKPFDPSGLGPVIRATDVLTRVIDERNELLDDIEKLTIFILGKGKFETLAEREQKAMKNQLAHMTGYFFDLEERLACFRERGLDFQILPAPRVALTEQLNLYVNQEEK